MKKKIFCIFAIMLLTVTVFGVLSTVTAKSETDIKPLNLGSSIEIRTTNNVKDGPGFRKCRVEAVVSIDPTINYNTIKITMKCKQDPLVNNGASASGNNPPAPTARSSMFGFGFRTITAVLEIDEQERGSTEAKGILLFGTYLRFK
jgi:hypothetical protein